MISRRIGLRRWIGHSAMAATIATQFGLAMMPPWCRIVWELISGTTKGTSGSMRKAQELSITIAPAATARGAHSRARPLPAENSAMSMRSKLLGANASTGNATPAKPKLLPAERGEAIRRRPESGNQRFSRQRISSTPTAPVAPTIATVGVASRALLVKSWVRRWAGRVWVAAIVLSINGPERTGPDTRRPRPSPAGP